MRRILILAIVVSALLDLTANLLATTFIPIGPFYTAVGTLTFALGYSLYDYIRRYHGRNATIVAVFAGAAGTLAYHFAFASEGLLVRIVVASLTALALASAVDIRLQTFLLDGPIWRLVLVTNGVSLLLDTIVFTLVAFLGVDGIPIGSLIVGDYLTKIVMSFVSIPMIYGITLVVPYPVLVPSQVR